MGADPNCGTKVQKIFDICKFLECRKWKNAKKRRKKPDNIRHNRHRAQRGEGVMSESNSDVTDEGKKAHKGDEGEKQNHKEPSAWKAPCGDTRVGG